VASTIFLALSVIAVSIVASEAGFGRTRLFAFIRITDVSCAVLTRILILRSVVKKTLTHFRVVFVPEPRESPSVGRARADLLTVLQRDGAHA